MCETTTPISTDARLIEIAFSMGREIGKLEGMWEARQILNEVDDERDASSAGNDECLAEDGCNCVFCNLIEKLASHV